MRALHTRWISFVLAASILPTTTVAGAADWNWADEPGESLALRDGETVVWQFHYGKDQPKPFFHPVALPDGRVVTWDRPPDHVWHHGLWFSWKFLDGVNYWEPDNTGKPPGRTEWPRVEIERGSDFSANIVLGLRYRPADQSPLLLETRTIRISPPDELGQYHFDWTCKFTAGEQDVELNRTPLEGEPGGQAWGGYAGLSLRLAKDLADRAATSTEGPVEFNAQSRSRYRSRATDYHGLVDGRPLGVAMCDHPDNLNHPSPWYVIRSEQMSYYSPAVICYGPHTLKAGESLTLRYRVLVHPGRWDAQQLDRAYRDFVESP